MVNRINPSEKVIVQAMRLNIGNGTDLDMPVQGQWTMHERCEIR